MPQSALKKINRAMEITWLLIIALVPLYFDRFLFNPWEMAKNILFQSLTEILVAFYLIKIALKYLNFAPTTNYEFKRITNQSKYLIPGTIFITILGLSTIFSQVPWFSFWGNWERRLGYLAWLHFFVFATILFFNLKSEKQIQRIIITIIITTTIVVIYGFIQLLGLEPFEWTEDVFLTHRVYSTIGQPNFLGSWLLLVIPIILYGVIKFKKFLARFLIALLLLSAVACFVLTQSRGGWLGFVIALFFFLIVFFWQKKKKKIVLAFSMLILIGFASIIYFNFSHPLQINPTDNFLIVRLKTFSNVKVFGQYRLMHWQAALKIIKNRSIGRILLGSGLGSQRFYLPKYYRPEFAIYESPNIYLDYVHNDILDTLLTSGVLGLISYLSLIGLIFYFGFKGMRENILSLFLLTGLVGYLISLQFSFHIMSTLPYFWLFIILLLIIPLKQDPALAVTNSIRLTDDQQWNSEIIGQQNNRILKNFSIVLIVFLTCFLIWWFNLRLYLASHYLLKATLEKLKNNWSAMVKYHELSVKYQPDNPYFRQQFALALLQSAPFQKNPDQIIKFYDLGINQIKAIPFQEWPIEARHWIAWLLTEKANFTHNQNDFREAKKAYQELADFTPGTALVYNNWCGLLVAEQKWMESIKMCQKAISLYPDLNHPQLNSEHREKIIAELISVYHKLAIAYFQLQDYQTSLSYYEKILHLDPNQTIIWLKIAQIYYLQKDIETAINKLYHGYIREPQNSQWALILSDLYQEKGDLEKANYWSMIAKTLNH